MLDRAADARAARARRARVVPFIPHRARATATTSPTPACARRATRARASWSPATAARARSSPSRSSRAAGVDVIVTDHHLPGRRRCPTCYAVLNPKRPGCDYPGQGPRGGRRRVQARARASRARSARSENPVLRHARPRGARDHRRHRAAARREPRARALRPASCSPRRENVGLRALIRASGLDGKPLTAGRVGFILAPRLNAVGRLGHALRGVELLIAETRARGQRDRARARGAEPAAPGARPRARSTRRAGMVDALDLDATYGHRARRRRVAPRRHRHRRVAHRRGDGAADRARSRSRTARARARAARSRAFDLHAGARRVPRPASCASAGTRRRPASPSRAEQVAAFAERFNAVARERLTVEDLVPELRVDLELAARRRHRASSRRCSATSSRSASATPSPVLVARGVRARRAAAHASARTASSCASRRATRRARGDRLGAGARAPALLAGDAGRRRLPPGARRVPRRESRLQAKLADVAPSRGS